MYDKRIERAIDSMHTQLLYLEIEKRRSVSVEHLKEYFAHLETILRGSDPEEGE